MLKIIWDYDYYVNRKKVLCLRVLFWTSYLGHNKPFV